MKSCFLIWKLFWYSVLGRRRRAEPDSKHEESVGLSGAVCTELTCTAETHVNKANQADYLCAGASCTTDADINTCCNAKCSTLTCTAATHVNKTNKDSLVCAGSPCTVDENACCDPRALCNSLECNATSHVRNTTHDNSHCKASLRDQTSIWGVKDRRMHGFWECGCVRNYWSTLESGVYA